MLGVGWEHGDDGERFTEGWDRAAALDALERAVELDDASPTSTQLSRSELALVLEHDSAGQRWGGGAELGKALAIYRELSRRGPDVEPARWEVLYRARRWPELLDATSRTLRRRVEEERHRRELRLAAATMLEGPRAALEEAARLAPRTDAQVALLVGASHRLLMVREYREAAGLLRRIAPAAPDPDKVLDQAETLARARRHEVSRLSDAHPDTLVVSVLAALARGDLQSEDWQDTELSRLLHRAVRVGGGGDALRQALLDLDQRLFAPPGDMPPEVARDLALAALETFVEGDEGLGRRVTARVGERSERFYVSRDDGGEGPLRLVAVDAAPWALGVAVSGRLARRDLDGARQWLDWAHEALSLTAEGGEVGSVPFVRFWTPGRRASTEDFEFAAALLLAMGPTAETARAELRDVVAASHDEVERAAAEEALRAIDGRAVGGATADTTAEITADTTAEITADTTAEITAERLAEIEAVLGGELAESLEMLRRTRLSDALRDYAVARILARLGFTDRARELYEGLLVASGEAIALRARRHLRQLPRRSS